MKNYYFLFVSLCGLFWSCNGLTGEDEPQEPRIRTLQVAENSLVNSSSSFAMDLFQQLQTQEAPNQFFSPYSIHLALAMAMNGNEGETLEQFRKVLHFEGLNMEEANEAAGTLTRFLLELDPKVRLAIANAIWYKQGYTLDEGFASRLRETYDAELAAMDMSNPQAADIINQWIETNTEGLIKDMLDQVPASAVMYLVNAIYFKADWKYRFDEKLTKKAPFTTSDGSEVQVDMMQLAEATTLKFRRESGLDYLEIPYSTGQYSLGILTSDEGLQEKLEGLDLEMLERIREEAEEMNLLLHMPKFKMRYKVDNLKEDLISLGLTLPFQNHPGNFTRLFANTTAPMKISRVIHEALIEVDEKGSEAAAATIVEIRETSAPSFSEYRLDKPFVFFIQEKHSGAILFMGKLGDPSLLD
ncbi:serpin family protein [Cyclobacterium jeungdonense]|uniref:Serpin family protein n=1 Tax=Cyclobacterium jeungdonense TaxID=708087 RepID=A0ABT8C1M2_9BACT|nr:serpin family protein [Cyclobacterium jeungdonense]MDN3686695.1 serpin family protein [Cyclobacterium jeungdonense]